MSKRGARPDQRRSGACGSFLCITLAWVYLHFAHLEAFLAIGAGLASGLVLVFAWAAIEQAAPLAVPVELAETVVAWQRDGWRTARLHPQPCCWGADPHVHLVRGNGRQRETRVISLDKTGQLTEGAF